MTRALSTPAWLLAPMAATVLATSAVYSAAPSFRVDFERSYEGGFVSGFHPRERSGGEAFRWTTGESYLNLHHLPRGGTVEVLARLRALPLAENPFPALRFTADGITVFRATAERGVASYRARFPVKDSSLRLGIHSDTFEAGGSRTLGVQALSFDFRFRDGRAARARPLAWLSAAAALCLLAALAGGLTPPYASILATGTMMAFVHLLAQDAARFTSYPRRLALLAAVGLAVSLAGRALAARATWLPPRRRGPLVALLSFSLLLKLGALLHPSFVSSDALFQANRLLEVMGGNWHPSSVTQHVPPFHIPYPASLFVLAAPFARLGFDPVVLLQVAAAVADVAVGLALAYLACRFLNDCRAGLLGAVLYQLVPMNFLAFSSGNLTNLFGVATTVFFLSCLAAAASGAGALALVGLFGFSLIALTAHFGTLLMGSILWPLALAAILWAVPWPPGRRGRLAVALSTGAGAGLALAYYAGYRGLIASQWERALSGSYATGEAVVSSPLAKLAFNAAFWSEQIGVVFLLLAALGALPVVKRFDRTAFHAAATAWLLSALAFLVLDLTTAVEIRYVLQTLPLLALFAGVFLSGAWERGRAGRVAAIAASAYIAAIGLWNLRDAVFYRYH